MIAINNKARLLYFIVSVFVIIKIILALQFHPAGWDESVYVGMGKHIYSAGNSGLWEQFRPLGLPFMLGTIWKLGLPFAFFAELLMLAFAVGNVLLVYFIAKKLFNKTTGLLSVLLVIGSAIFFKQSSLFLTEVPSTFFALATLYFLINKKIAIASVFAALAALFKFPHLLLLIVLFLLPLLERNIMLQAFS